MTTTVQPGTGTPADEPQKLRPKKPGKGSGSATWPVRIGLLFLCIAWMVAVARAGATDEDPPAPNPDARPCAPKR